ncbi:MAG TPA: CoA transferase [Dehalococcoidia bacterium]|nr:CoA transferase [Dehalococcoidia bacterium]
MAEANQPRYSSGNPRPDAPKALGGLRVLDFSTVLAGPLCAGLLGEFGAEVIKVEQPGVGDTLRQITVQDLPLWWLVEARNKRSITLNLRVPEGQDLAKKLITKSDVLVENFLPGTMAKWNLGYDQVRAVNPKIIFASVSGYGQTGPYRQKYAYDRVAVAMGGWAYVTGEPDRPPSRPGIALADYATGFVAALGVVTSLYHRDAQGGGGQQVDASLLDTAIRMSEALMPAYDKLGVIRERMGNRHPSMAPGDHYRTRDNQWVSLNAGSDRIFPRLIQLMDRPDLLKDPRFATAGARIKHNAEINDIVAEWVAEQDRDDLVRWLEEVGVPGGPIYTAKDMVADPHFIEREMVVEIDDPTAGRLKMQGITPKLSETPGRIERPAPTMGEANRDIYCGLLGLSEADLERLTKAGVI